jgi:capsular exopolysaccharide synthesis family protein
VEEQEIHIRDYLRILYKRKNTVIAFFYIVVTVVVTKTLLATPIYQATTRALIEKSQPQNLSLVNSYYMPWDPEFYETQVQIVKSVAIAEKVVEMLSLVEKYDSYMKEDEPGFSLVAFIKGLLPGRGGDPGEGDAPGDVTGFEEESPSLALARMISGGLSVTPVKDSKIVTISYMSSNPELAALIVNTVTKAYMEELLEMKMSSSRYSIRWMSEKAEEERAKLEKSERDLQAYMKANDIITLENRITVLPQKLSELSVGLTKAETRRKELEDLYRMVEGASGDLTHVESIPVVQNDPTLQTLKSGILKAEQNISELSKKYGEKHPAMKAARSDLQVLREKREQEIVRAVQSVKNEYELALSNERSLRQRLSNTKASALNLNEKFIQYEVLKRAVDTNQQFYNALITKTKEQSITEQIQSINVWILEEAEAPDFPVKPRKYRNILLGIIVGLFGGVGMAFFVEYLDNSIKSPEEVEARTGLPVLGVVPRMKEKGKKMEEVVLKEPRTHLGESYKALRTAVLLSSAETPPKSILVTSMVSGEGKTSTAVNLAVATAMSGYSTLLVDGDLRRPNIHKIFGMRNLKGLSTYLAGVSDADIIMESPVTNLSIVTPGPVPPNPSELLGSDRLGEIMETFKRKFDIIFFDSAPILTVADSFVLSQNIETCIVVARAGKTTYEMVRRGVRFLQDIRSNVLGLVINAYDEKSGGSYYYRHSDYYYIGDVGQQKPAK